jgi:hypothetical protein
MIARSLHKFLLILSLPKQKSLFGLSQATTGLGALAVNDARSALVVFVLLDPHVFERRERREDRSSDPDGVLG